MNIAKVINFIIYSPFIASFLSSAIVTSIMVYYLNKKNEKYKAELQNKLERDKTIFSSIYVEKAKLIKELYAKIYMVKDSANYLVTVDIFLVGVERQQIEESFLNFREHLKNFRHYYHSNKIFINKEISDIIEEFEYTLNGIHDVIYLNENRDDLLKINDEKIPRLQQKLEEEFKKALEGKC